MRRPSPTRFLACVKAWLEDLHRTRTTRYIDRHRNDP